MKNKTLKNSKNEFKFLLQLMNYIEKLGNNKIGFTLNSGLPIKRRTFQYVSYFWKYFTDKWVSKLFFSISSYFLILQILYNFSIYFLLFVSIQFGQTFNWMNKFITNFFLFHRKYNSNNFWKLHEIYFLNTNTGSHKKIDFKYFCYNWTHFAYILS